MDKNRATFEAYDGVELRLLNGRVVRCPALTVAEAAHFLRMGARVEDGDYSGVDEFVAAFPVRIGVLKERLVDLGLVVEGPAGPLAFGDLTLEDGLALARLYGEAVADAKDARSSKAKVRVLDEWPATFGFTAGTPGEVFQVARSFAEALYLHVYGLAKDFLDHLTLSPGVRVMTLRATDYSSMLASTT